ncbi:MAG: hypothetical protein R2795_08195 [Saprospiraceae bacterium]
MYPTDTFVVEGGHTLKGEIMPQGAKNEALQVLCAVLLTSEPVVISNLPDIQDVAMLIALIKGLGVEVTRLSHDTYRFEARDVNLEYVLTQDYLRDASRIRGRSCLLAIVGRFGQASLPKP